MTQDAQKAKSYFDALAPEYDRAFRRQGQGLLSALVNRTFRGPTFVRRMRMLEALFTEIGLPGKSVLDLGCGSGQVSLLAASMGAQVRALDIAPRMLDIARESGRNAGLSERMTFEEADVSTASLAPADVVLLVGVIEYYRDQAALVSRAASATQERLVIAHTRRVLHRMVLRRLLFLLHGSNLYFHRMDQVIAAAQAAGMRLEREIPDAGFSLLVFGRA